MLAMYTLDVLDHRSKSNLHPGRCGSKMDARPEEPWFDTQEYTDFVKTSRSQWLQKQGKPLSCVL